MEETKVVHDKNYIEPARRQLPADVARKYDTVGVRPGWVVYKGQRINLTTISLQQADELARDGNFPYLERKDPEEPKKK